MEAARTFKVNLKLDGKPCGWCQQPLHLGEDVAVCATCDHPHHSRCWESSAGCATAGCTNAPLPRLDAPPVPPPGAPPPAPITTAPPGMMYCRQCGNLVSTARAVCSYCRAVTASPAANRTATGGTAPGATAALVFGLVGLFICGVIFGPIALMKSSEARQAIANDPSLDGGGMATAGLVLGIIDLVLWAIIMVARVG
jgi:hypothetical protein